MVQQKKFRFKLGKGFLADYLGAIKIAKSAATNAAKNNTTGNMARANMIVMLLGYGFRRIIGVAIRIYGRFCERFAICRGLSTIPASLMLGCFNCRLVRKISKGTGFRLLNLEKLSEYRRMHSYLNHLSKVFGPIMHMSSDGMPIVLYSQIRLIRNLNEFPFPISAPKDALRAANEAITGVVAKDLCDFSTLAIDDLDQSDKRFCVERRWASKRWERQEIGSVSISGNCDITITTNEEDHIGIRALLGGLNLMSAYERVNNVDDTLSRHLVYAFDGQLGYLTTKPIRTGIGLSACVCVHIPALVWGEKIAPIALAARAIGCNIIGFNGRESSTDEDLFFISNRPGFEGDEIAILTRLNSFAEMIMESEKNARKAFLERTEARLRDRFYRVLAVLKNATIIDLREAQVLLMQMRMATDLQWLPPQFRHKIDALLISLRPAHLKAAYAISDGQEDFIRAEILHEIFANAQFIA
ncbi:MAG: hypothetical protein LBD72_03645 [Puniceicoccales bacterium]|jgi:protein arginine kinase|nr:hypothetical protein [Puniceicoccales bacterium]